MARENKYGDVHVKGIPEDEPIFIFRAQDAFAGIILRMYQTLLLSAGRRDMADNMKLAVNRFDAWETKKIPD